MSEKTQYNTVVVTMEGMPDDKPLTIFLYRKDKDAPAGILQAQITVAAGMHLIADADGVRAESLEAGNE